MTDNAFFQLLKEVKTICETNGIEYFLGGKILYFSMFPEKEIPENFTSIEVLMDGKNARKFLKACENLPKNRVLESPLRNKKFRNLDMYYINKESTYINFKLLDRREFLGIHIPIRIIQPVRKSSKLKPLNKLEKLWRTNYSFHHSFDAGTENYEKANTLFGRFTKDGDKVTVAVFRQLLRTSIKGNESSFKIYTCRRRKAYPPRLFSETTQVHICGESFVTMKDMYKYLEQTYGKNWISFTFSEERVYMDSKNADSAYEKELYENQEFWDELLESRRIYQKNVISDNVYRQNWKMVLCIYKGILLQDKLKRRKEELLRRLELEDYSGILITMEDYEQVLDMNTIYRVPIDEELRELYEKAKNEVA